MPRTVTRVPCRAAADGEDGVDGLQLWRAFRWVCGVCGVAALAGCCADAPAGATKRTARSRWTSSLPEGSGAVRRIARKIKGSLSGARRAAPDAGPARVALAIIAVPLRVTATMIDFVAAGLERISPA